MQQRCHHIFDWGWFGRHGAWGSPGALLHSQAASVGSSRACGGIARFMRSLLETHLVTSSLNLTVLSRICLLFRYRIVVRGDMTILVEGFVCKLTKLVTAHNYVKPGRNWQAKNPGASYMYCIVWYSVSNIRWVYIVYSLSIFQSLSVLSRDMWFLQLSVCCLNAWAALSSIDDIVVNPTVFAKGQLLIPIMMNFWKSPKQPQYWKLIHIYAILMILLGHFGIRMSEEKNKLASLEATSTRDYWILV